MWTYFGLPSLKPQPLQMPVFNETPRRLTTEEAQRQRTADKRALFGRFGMEIVQVAKRRELLRIFARRVERDVKAVHADVHALLNAGILDRTKNGQIVFPYEAVHVDFTLYAAA